MSFRPPAVWLVVVSLLIATSATYSQQSARPGLFRAAGVLPDARASTDLDRADALRYVDVDISVLSASDAQARAAIELDLDILQDANGQAMVAAADNVYTLNTGRMAWTGHLAGVDLSAVTLVADQSAGTLTGSISFPNGLFRIEPISGTLHRVIKLNPALFPPEDAVAPPAMAPPGPAAEPPLPAAGTDPQAAEDSGATIDVLVVYTPATRAAGGGTANMTALVDLAVAETNQSYANSGINPRVNLVHAEEVAYTESDDWSEGMRRLLDAADGYMDSVHALRDAHSADLVVLIVESTALCGLAAKIGQNSPADAPSGFVMVARLCATGYYSFAHELGHIQGARHDRYVDSIHNSPFSYNHGYFGASWRTIMV